MKECDCICIFIQGDAALFLNAEFIDRTDIGLQLLVVIYVIEAGDEICINYMPMEDEGCDNREVRQEYLRRYYGFQCCCKACTLQVWQNITKTMIIILYSRTRN